MKNEKLKLFYFILFFTFFIWKGYIFLENILWENVVYTITFPVKIFLALQDI